MFAISVSEYESSKLPDFYHKLFRAVENDPKFTRLDYLQEYSRKLKARNERSEEVYKRTRPIDGRLARAHGLHKLQKKKKKKLPIFSSSDQSKMPEKFKCLSSI